MAENAPYRIRNVIPAKNTKSMICRLADFQNTSPYPSDWNQRRSTQYDNPIRPQMRTPKAKATKRKIPRRRHVELRCCVEFIKSGKSGNVPRARPSLDKHSDCRLLTDVNPGVRPGSHFFLIRDWGQFVPESDTQGVISLRSADCLCHLPAWSFADMEKKDRSTASAIALCPASLG